MSSNKYMNCREIAYLAYLKALRDEAFISEVLNDWQKQTSPSEADYRLAQEIAYGTCQRALTLEYYAEQLTTKKLKLKRKEKALLYTALYQHLYLDRVPPYAIANESLNIAKKYCHTTFSKFLNAILRKSSSIPLTLPTDNSIASLAIQYSYPEYFIKNLIADYNLQTALEVMKAGNTPSLTMARVRGETAFNKLPNCEINMAVIDSQKELVKAAKNKNLYIQNITPALLFEHAVEKISPPKTILDLCSSPGGKIILSHDHFPEAKLFANDISENKIKTLKENIDRYEINATVSIGLGEQYKSDQPLDLIIIDTPCSNSGVLNKRPEARWRQTKQSHAHLELLQKSLLENALKNISQNGYILYMTCSIIKSENEKLIETFSKQHNVQIVHSETILPSREGYDGGFAALLTKT